MLHTQHSLSHADTEDGRAYLDYECAKELLEALVAERGDDFVYEAPPVAGDEESTGCAYAVEDEAGHLTPSCGVGWVIGRLSPEALRIAHTFDPSECRSTGVTSTNVLMQHDVLRHIVTTPEARTLLREFQYHQDRGTPYRESLDLAIARPSRADRADWES